MSKKNNSTGLTGVCAYTSPSGENYYRVWIHNPSNVSRMKAVGTFSSLEEASAAHDEASFSAFSFRYPLHHPEKFFLRGSLVSERGNIFTDGGKNG